MAILEGFTTGHEGVNDAFCCLASVLLTHHISSLKEASVCMVTHNSVTTLYHLVSKSAASENYPEVMPGKHPRFQPQIPVILQLAPIMCNSVVGSIAFIMVPAYSLKWLAHPYPRLLSPLVNNLWTAGSHDVLVSGKLTPHGYRLYTVCVYLVQAHVGNIYSMRDHQVEYW